MTQNQQERLNQLRQYAQKLKEKPETREAAVNVLAWIILIETDE